MDGREIHRPGILHVNKEMKGNDFFKLTAAAQLPKIQEMLRQSGPGGVHQTAEKSFGFLTTAQRKD